MTPETPSRTVELSAQSAPATSERPGAWPTRQERDDVAETSETAGETRASQRRLKSVDMMPHNGAVTYFIQAENGGPIKIGRSTRFGVEARLEQLQTSNPFRLVIRRVDLGDLEEEMHHRYRDARLCGEWFAPVPALAEFARAIPDETPYDEASADAAYRRGLRDGRQQAVDRIGECGGLIAAQIASSVADLVSGKG